MTHPLRAIVAVLFLLPATANAQQLTAASFRPDEPQGEVVVDLRALRERGIWEEVERTLLRPVFREMEQELGFPLETLDRLHLWIRTVEQRAVRLAVLEGKVELPPRASSGSWTDEQIGDHQVKVQGNAVIARVGSALLVEGPRELVEPVLRGETKGGLPGADQLSMLSGRTTDLVHVFADLVAARGSKGEFGFLSQIEYPEDDPATHLVLRIGLQGTDDDARLLLEGIVRHRRGERGIELTETAAKEWLAGLQQHPRLGALKKLWSAVAIERQGADLKGTLELGAPRAAVANIAQLLMPLLGARLAAREAAATEMARAVEAERRAAEEARRRAEEEARKKESGGR